MEDKANFDDYIHITTWKPLLVESALLRCTSKNRSIQSGLPAAWQFYLQRVSVAVRKVGTEMGLILGNGRGLDT